MEKNAWVIIAATGNPDKLREFKEIMPKEEGAPGSRTLGRLISMKEAGFSGEIEETGATFQENARLKARAVWEYYQKKHPGTPCLVIADDSGLEIDYFDKAPGVYSSRWLGEDTPYTEKNAFILRKMEGVEEEKRSARYVCAICCVRTDGEEILVTETVEGEIGREAKGEGGFGYDPIFVVPGLGTLAEVSPEAKNAVSHRGKALRALEKRLREAGFYDSEI